MQSSLPTQRVVTGRGSSAIYLTLRHLSRRLQGPGVMVAPANVCYAALYPALYAGWSVRLVDVSPHDGNLTTALVEEALGASRADALLAPHMYGQPIADLPDIADACRRDGVALVEDCASAMGASSTYPLGKVGDYVVFSTGYAKVVDVGFGGLLASERHGLDWVEDANAKLSLRTEALEQTETLFGKLYRTLRSFPDGRLDQAVYGVLPQATRELFLNRLSDEQAERVLVALRGLDQIVAQRRGCQAACLRLWEQAAPVRMRPYPYATGAVPWRFSWFIEPGMRAPLVAACLDAGIPISDWYPSVAPMLGDLGSYPAAEAMGATILNLPLTNETVELHMPRMLELAARLQKEH